MVHVMLLRASLIWLPMQLLVLWGQVWVLRVGYSGWLSESVMVVSTLAAIGLLAWNTLPWVTRKQPASAWATVAGVWSGSTIAAQLVLAASSFGSWSLAGQAFTVGGLLNLGNLSIVLMAVLPVAYWRHRPVTEPTESTPVRESPRNDLVVAPAHSA